MSLSYFGARYFGASYFIPLGAGTGDTPVVTRLFGVGGGSVVEQFLFTTLTVSQGPARQTGGDPTGSGVGGGGQPQ